ncbi:MBOAT family O-acyltransferase [Pseudoduganella buxea]|uniref:Probable alginate O-acetylase AlgI n=1 Tax=Pseudoduganella buxea TaxID=1949069 RepID=A0A6I3SWG7_9BURK|nr:MBOAT family protein [Pseudoduganella buxea]MTV53374.1 MBOAT family protein [Pseudoduganella buxea]GGC07208.1 alginate O-acetylation protein [Pseudoduganella buxea]
MLFNSHAFLFGFLPVVLLAYFAAARRGGDAANAVLAAASLFFYGWWDVRYLPLLLASIAINYGCSLRIRAAAGQARSRWLAAAVAANLALLGWYKYAGFFAQAAGQLTGWQVPLVHIVLPVGISFFTFTQIAFLVDTARGLVHESRFLHYLLFVTYFPHLVAGPVLHHREMMPQFADPANLAPRAANFAIGGSIFVIGLAKKVLVADSLAPHANVLFAAPEGVSLLVAWGGVLAYTFQLYFDFSGYSDMAIGLSRLFGVRLPLNFDSPYKAVTITEFWRRWHMTLSRFLRDYLYVPLGGNRKGPLRRHVNLLATMLLGGLWHGAGWNFVIWGALHGVYLVVAHGWSALRERLGCNGAGRAWRLCAWALTFGAVCVAWVFFRAPDVAGALAILRGMVGAEGVALPAAIGMRLGGLQQVLEGLGVSWYLGGGTRLVETWSWVALGAVLALAMPNTQQIMRRWEPALDARPAQGGPGWLAWQPGRRQAVVLGVLAVLSVLSLNQPSDFLYFQF